MPASGVASVSLYDSINNGPFTLYQTLTLTSPSTSGTLTFSFAGKDRNLYAFHSIATDAAGNTESKSSTAIEASTSVPDLNPPVTHVLSSSQYNNGVFTLDWSGTDPDQNTGTPPGSIALVNIYVEIDGDTPTLIGQLNGGTPNSSGAYSGSMTYNALGDNQTHTYGFFSVGIDDQQKVQYAPQPGPTSPDVTFGDINHSAALAIQQFAVEKFIAERSFIQYLDVDFNQNLATTPIGMGGLTSDPGVYVELLWYGENLNASSSPAGSVNLFGTGTTAKVSLSGNDLSINFGPNGITSLLTETGVSGTGSPTSTFGDGWYALGIDPTGDPSNGQVFWLPFFRLLGSATGDLTVSGPYTAIGTDAYAVYHAEGQSGTLMDADVNGDGAVNTKDLTETVAADNHAVGTTPPETFPQFQLLAGAPPASGNAIAVTQTQVQALLPDAVAAWQAAGLDAADLRGSKACPSRSATWAQHPGPRGGRHASRSTRPPRASIGISVRPAIGKTGLDGESLASSASPAAGDVDLLTVLEHELGHVLGLADNNQAGDLMDITLGLGVRRSPTSADVAAVVGNAIGTAPIPPVASVPAGLPSEALVDAALDSILGPVGIGGPRPDLNVTRVAPPASMGPIPGQGATSRKKNPGRRSAPLPHRGFYFSRNAGKTRLPGQSSASGPISYETTRGE